MKEFYISPESTVFIVKIEGEVCASPGLEDYNKHDYYEE